MFRYWEYFSLVSVHKGVSNNYIMTLSRILLSGIRKIHIVV